MKSDKEKTDEQKFQEKNDCADTKNFEMMINGKWIVDINIGNKYEVIGNNKSSNADIYVFKGMKIGWIDWYFILKENQKL